MALYMLRVSMLALVGCLLTSGLLAQTGGPAPADPQALAEIRAKLEALSRKSAEVKTEADQLIRSLESIGQPQPAAAGSPAAIEGTPPSTTEGAKPKAAIRQVPTQKSAVQQSPVQAPPKAAAPAGVKTEAKQDQKASPAPGQENKPAETAPPAPANLPLQNLPPASETRIDPPPSPAGASPPRAALTEPAAPTIPQPVARPTVASASVAVREADSDEGDESQEPAENPVKPDPAERQSEIGELVKKYLIDNVKPRDAANFEDTSKRLANRLSNVVKVHRNPKATEVSAVRDNALEEFGGVIEPLNPDVQAAWRAARAEFEKQVSERYQTETVDHWLAIYEATALGLALDAVKDEGRRKDIATNVAKEVAAGIWLQSAKDFGTSYWDQQFDESAAKLATRMEAVASDTSLTSAVAIQNKLVSEMDAFLLEINNDLVPEKTTAWIKLLTAWRNRLKKAHDDGTLEGTPEALRVAIQEGAKDLRAAGEAWRKERGDIARNQAGSTRGSQGSGGMGGVAFYGTPHHARKVRRIYGRHYVQMARIQGITGGR